MYSDTRCRGCCANPEPGTRNPRHARTPTAVCLIAIAIGGAFVWAGIAKGLDPGPTIGMLREAFGVPVARGRVVVLTLAGLEWLLGVWLICGIRQVVSLTATGSVSIAFTGALAIAQHRGFTGDCGCGFGSMNVSQALIRNGLLLALLAVLLVAAPRWTHTPREGAIS